MSRADLASTIFAGSSHPEINIVELWKLIDSLSEDEALMMHKMFYLDGIRTSLTHAQIQKALPSHATTVGNLLMKVLHKLRKPHAKRLYVVSKMTLAEELTLTQRVIALELQVKDLQEKVSQLGSHFTVYR